MINYRSEQTINRPVADVFPYVADPTLYPRWMPVSEVQEANPGDMRVGATVQMKMKMGQRPAPFTYEITEYEPNVRIGFRTTKGPAGWEATFTLEPTGEGATRIVGSGSIRLKGWQRLMAPFMRGEVQRGEAAELAGLKVLLESQP